VRQEPLRTPVLSKKCDSGKKAFAPRRLPPLVERIERALVLAAYVVVRHGPVYAPLVDRLERELEIARRSDPTERAKRILDAYGSGGKQTRHGDATRGLARKRFQSKRLPAKARHD
jgi:hypothetical protein